jgi:hypothetical protein
MHRSTTREDFRIDPRMYTARSYHRSHTITSELSSSAIFKIPLKASIIIHYQRHKHSSCPRLHERYENEHTTERRYINRYHLDSRKHGNELHTRQCRSNKYGMITCHIRTSLRIAERQQHVATCGNVATCGRCMFTAYPTIMIQHAQRP